MSETTPNLSIRGEIVNILSQHKSRVLSGDRKADERVLGVVTSPSHPRFLEVGIVVSQGWYGEGGLTLRFRNGEVASFGGLFARGGVADRDIGEISPDYLSGDEKRRLKEVLFDPGNLLGEE